MKLPVSPIVLTTDELQQRLNMGDDFIKEIITNGKVLYPPGPLPEISKEEVEQEIKTAEKNYL